jgi:hypothetical protein
MAEDWQVAPVADPWQKAQPLDNSEFKAAHELRPLSTGEVLDRTFSIYRSRFWLFAGLASLSGSFSLVLNLLHLLAHHLLLVHAGFNVAQIEASLSSLVIVVLVLPVGAVVYAASVFALCEIYLGREIDAKNALKATVGRWLRYVGIALWQGWSASWIFLLLFVPLFALAFVGRSGGNTALLGIAGLLMLLVVPACTVYGVIAYIRNSLAIPAALMENTGVRASMRRSKTLAKGTKGRIFVLFLIAFVLYLVALVVEVPLLIVIGRAPLQEHVMAQAVILLVSFLAQTLVSPVALIGLTLVYFDQRVRHEAFDLLVMLGPEATPVEAQPLVWPPPAPEPSGWPPAPAEPSGWPPPPPVAATVAAPPFEVASMSPEPVVAPPSEEVPSARADDETPL